MTLRNIGKVNGTNLGITYDDEVNEVLLSDDQNPTEPPYRFTTEEFFSFCADSRRLAALLARIIRNPTTGAVSPADQAARAEALTILSDRPAATMAVNGGRR
jgi:hypothetical protein